VKPFTNKIFNIKDEEGFAELALSVFEYQATENAIYAAFLERLGTDISAVRTITAIPFLPIEFFKSHKVITGESSESIVFTSSGTTGLVQSRHYVVDVELYRQSYTTAFRRFYGHPAEYCILALLPSYLEREGSSLIYMAEDLIGQSTHPSSGFYLNEFSKLANVLRENEAMGQKTILLGVTYALLDLLEVATFSLKNTIIMETGGMKGKRKEMIREELHEILCKGFGVSAIHSEYGMTELLSQAYSRGQGIFETPPWMKILIRDTNDPFHFLPPQRSGGINVIDLANLNSCSFIATQDLGKTDPDGKFEVLGRFDNSDIRGCNLMIS
jgi:hypothetical protein